MLRRLHRLPILAAAILGATLAACAPAPDRELTEDEKTADMMWIYSIFDQNYAPRALKEQLHGFDYEDLKADYLAQAAATADNEEFFALMHQFVAEFHDVHTSSSLIASSLPGRTEIAYLGFNGVRSGDGLEVTELFPTTASSPSFPVQVGDRIIALDGVPLRDVVLDEMVRYRSLGYDEANLTYHMNGIFSRTPLAMPLPEAEDAVLTVDRFGTEREITLPWVRRDLVQFLDEQQAASAGSNFKIAGVDAEAYLEAAREVLATGSLDTLDIPIAGLPGENTWSHFKFIDNMPTLVSRSIRERIHRALRASSDEQASVDDIRSYLGAFRNIPSGAILLEESTMFPAYIAKFPNKFPDQPPRFYGYILLDTFSPADEQLALFEIEDTLARFEDLGVEHLIIDTIDNGGGSLVFGMKLAQLLSRDPLELPRIQFKLSETWIDQFYSASLYGSSDAEQELARRVYEDLIDGRDAGALLSEPMPIDVLMPFQFIDGNEDLPQLEMTVLVNEMCVSMCDIFAATLKDNGLATIIGKRTMGGGGNVVQYGQAPNSNLVIAQTESLILRADGTPIENHGVEPDVEMEVHETAASRYDAVRDRAVELLSPCDASCIPADELVPAERSGGCSTSGSPHSALALLLLAVGLLSVRRRRTGLRG